MLNNTEEKQRNYYNKISRRYDSFHNLKPNLNYRFNLYNRFLKKIKLNKESTVLDAMCGGGQNSYYFDKNHPDASVTGIDISEEQIISYRKRFKKNKAVTGSIINTGFEDNCYDLVVIESLHHLHPHVNDGIAEIDRILKPGGYLFIWEPNSNSFIDFARKLWYRNDPVFFESNESSIDCERIESKLKNNYSISRKEYGGSFGYILTMGSMYLRMPKTLLQIISPLGLAMESYLNFLHCKFFSCWFALLLKKI
jgi:ubiquinone/menaquinone biosynthesis C-methylase UbiE